jgi:4-amino-4-deoxy-L-arabinose transferase-like glycosyltransferase
MKKQDVVSLVILAVLCVLSMVNIVWMVITNHPDMAIVSAVVFAMCSFCFMYEVKDK